MSYRIDGETPYWGGLEVPSKERKDVTNEIHIGKWDAISEYWTMRMQPIVDKIMKDVEEDYKKLSDLLVPPSEETMDGMRRVLEQGLTKNENKMEKKTKKMTKAEAFEWLKCKKIDACGQVEAVQKKLFSLGVVWISGDKSIYDFGRYCFVDEKGKLGHCDGFEDFWIHHSFEKITAEDILSLEIEEECAKYDEDPYFVGRIKDLQEMIGDDEVIVITKMNFLTMTK